MNLNFKQKNNTKSAFTLVEALVAISILMIAIASPMTLAQKGLSTATLSKDQMTASFLVQDAIESVKNIRDQIAVSASGGDWLYNTVLDACVCKATDICNFTYPQAPTLKFCILDTTRAWPRSFPPPSDGPIQAGTSNNARLKITYDVKSDGTKQFLKYDYNTLSSCGSNPGVGPCSEDSKFSRYINIKKTSESGISADEAVINVRVEWNSPQGIQMIDVQDFIYNYSENL